MTPRGPGSPTPRRMLAWLLIAGVLLHGNWGCALLRDPDPPAFERISVRAEVDRDKRGALEGDLNAYSTLKGMLVGTVTGLPSGALTGATIAVGAGFLSCGVTAFLWPICVIFVTAAGAVIGGVVGLLGGGTMGFIGGLPSETAEQVTEALTRLEQGHRFDDDLLVAVRSAIPQERLAEEGAGGILLTARLADFDLRQHSKDRLSVRLRASMVQTWENEEGKEQENTCKYQFTSDKKPAETWLAAGGEPFRETVMQAFDTIARWMNRDLEAFASQSELQETEEDPASCFRTRRWYRLY